MTQETNPRLTKGLNCPTYLASFKTSFSKISTPLRQPVCARQVITTISVWAYQSPWSLIICKRRSGCQPIQMTLLASPVYVSNLDHLSPGVRPDRNAVKMVPSPGNASVSTVASRLGNTIAGMSWQLARDCRFFAAAARLSRSVTAEIVGGAVAALENTVSRLCR